MNKMSKAAKILDRIVAVIFWITLSVTALCILGGGILLLLRGRIPDRSDWPLTTLTFGSLELLLHPDAVPRNYGSYLLAAALFLLVHVPVFCIMLRTLRDTLKPFIACQPFHDTISRNLRKLAILVVVYTALTIVGEAFLTRLLVSIFDPASLLRNDMVLGVSVNLTTDLTPLLFAGALYLLSKVFLYGQELQQLSDETL